MINDHLVCPDPTPVLTELQSVHPPVHLHSQRALGRGASVSQHLHQGEDITHRASEYLTFPDLLLGLSESQAEAGLR